MSTMTISNPAVDQEAVALATKTYEAITPHWRAIIPALTVIIADKPFNRIPELREFRRFQNKQPGWNKLNWKHIQVACPEFDEKEAVLWVRYDRQSMKQPSDYYFQKELFAVIAKLIWCTSEKLRNEAKRQATGTGVAGSDGATYMAFRDTFSRFFLNPEYLMERKEEAWNFMVRIDRALPQTPCVPA